LSLLGYAPLDPIRPTPKVRGGTVRVLVIDDEPDVLLLCRVNLEHAGHDVLEAAEGRRGLELAATERPDLIVLDLMLPNIDGLQVLARLSNDPTTRGIPVVLLTAKARLEDQLRGWQAGCSEYITKPFAPNALTEVVERIDRMTVDERRVLREQAITSLEGRT
jgi:two-component system alkaline phosphatase synthesis response regulator PhoP